MASLARSAWFRGHANLATRQCAILDDAGRHFLQVQPRPDTISSLLEAEALARRKGMGILQGAKTTVGFCESVSGLLVALAGARR